MKSILITGANSFLGVSLENYLMQWKHMYTIDTIDMKSSEWSTVSFNGYDTVYHVAGIAHSDYGKTTDYEKQLYYEINTDLAIKTAEKAKKEGVNQFIFMSSAIVYGEAAPIGKEKNIDSDTSIAPNNYYSDSKAKAEEGLLLLENESFKVCILRPPMIYGKGCKGNYKLLSEIACKIKVFPKIENRRSMLYVGNLVEFIRILIENEEAGIFWPQNNEYVNTSQLVKKIATCNGKKVILIPGFEWLFKLFGKHIRLINKAFGNLTYDENLSKYKCCYAKYTLDDSIRETEI